MRSHPLPLDESLRQRTQPKVTVAHSVGPVRPGRGFSLETPRIPDRVSANS
jgi:hypothetical protein